MTGGYIALLSLPAKPTLVDWSKAIFKQLTLKGIDGREMFETCQKMAAMLESQLDLRKVITRRLPASRFLQGFETMRRGNGSGHGAEKREANFGEVLVSGAPCFLAMFQSRDLVKRREST